MRHYLSILSLVAVILLVQTTQAGLFDSLKTQVNKTKKNMTRDEKRIEAQQIAQDAMENVLVEETFDERQETGKKATNNVQKAKKASAYQDIDEDDDRRYIPESSLSQLTSENVFEQRYQKAMHEFVPEDQNTFILPQKDMVTWHFDIQEEQPVHVRGAYFVSGNQKREENRVNVIIVSPGKDILFKLNHQDKGIIAFDATEKGEYSITFFAIGLRGGDRQVTLMLHEDYLETANPDVLYSSDYEFLAQHEAAKQRKIELETEIQEAIEKRKNEAENPDADAEPENNSSNIATVDDTISMKQELKSMARSLDRVKQEARYSMNRQTDHNSEVLDNQTYSFWCLIIEVVIFIAIAFLQTRALKNMVDNKLLL